MDRKIIVLILSAKAQTSQWIPREIDLAIEGNKNAVSDRNNSRSRIQKGRYYLMNIDKYPDELSLEAIIKFIPKRFLKLGTLEVIRMDSKENIFRIRGKNDCALKVIFCRDNGIRFQEALYELSIMKELRGLEQVIQLLDWEVDEISKTVCWLEEYFQPLPNYLKSFGSSEYERLVWIRELCNVLSIMRNMGIYHLDIQPKNLFLKIDNKICIGNFSFAMRKNDIPLSRERKEASLFMAPEVYHENCYSELSEIYSLGSILYYLYNNQKVPFQAEMSAKEALKKRMSGVLIPDTICNRGFSSNDLNKLVRRCCAFDSTDRKFSFESLEAMLADMISLLKKENKGSMNRSCMSVGTEDNQEVRLSVAEEEVKIARHEVAKCEERLLIARKHLDVVRQERNINQHRIHKAQQDRHYIEHNLAELSKNVEEAKQVANREAQELTKQRKKVLEEEQQKLKEQLRKCEEAKSIVQFAEKEMCAKIYEYREIEKVVEREHEVLYRQTNEMNKLEHVIQQAKIELEKSIHILEMAEKVVQAEKIPVKAVMLRNVQFSALAPETLQKGRYGLIEIYMYEESFRKVVEDALADSQKLYKEKDKSGLFKVKDGASIRIVLQAEDLKIEVSDQTQTWYTDYLVFKFAVKIPKDYPNDEILFNASVYINNIKATNLIFVTECQEKMEKKGVKKTVLLRKDILSAFMSYASEDRNQVAIIKQGIQIGRPDLDIFFDVESLRSGEDWETTLFREIKERDILFLCWSLFAKQSKWVDAEWHYALKQKGIDYIEPIPIDTPKKCPPPPELQAKHFDDKLLYIINAKE